jgi:putative oxygen-independent coproporphyrinogen III oxidase
MTTSPNPRRVIPIARQDVKSTGSGLQPVKTEFALEALPPLSLYIHVPWCIRKCPYCDFNSHEAPDDLPESGYLQALTADLEQALPFIWGRQIHTIFIGGGTPSLLSAAALDQLIAMVRARLSIWPDAEITLEANPGASEAQKFASFAASGVNRLSIGVQSFNDNYLKALGRRHDVKQAMRAIEYGLRSFNRVNLDLMYGLPGQTASQWETELRTALAMGVQHLSLYQLTIEPQTVFAKFPPALPDDDVLGEMEAYIGQAISAHGWDRYEVSAFASVKERSRHNLNYWTFGDYLGIGPGAHSKLSFHDRIERSARTRNPEQWMQSAIRHDGSHVSETRRLSSTDLPFEFMLNALRLRQGVATSLFEERTGLSRLALSATLQLALERHLMSPDPSRLCATELGWRHLNILQSLFLEDEGSLKR